MRCNAPASEQTLRIINSAGLDWLVVRHFSFLLVSLIGLVCGLEYLESQPIWSLAVIMAGIGLAVLIPRLHQFRTVNST